MNLHVFAETESESDVIHAILSEFVQEGSANVALIETRVVLSANVGSVLCMNRVLVAMRSIPS